MNPPDPAVVPTAPLPARERIVSPSPLALLGVGLPLYALDQGTKWLVERHLALGEYRVVVPGFFTLEHSINHGAAFGMFQGGGAFFLVLAFAALVTLAVLWRQGTFAGGGWTAAGVCLLVPGILGNVTDRLTRGHVVDMLSFDLHVPGAQPFATFNVADSCICVAVTCFLIGSFAESRKVPAAGAEIGDRR